LPRRRRPEPVDLGELISSTEHTVARLMMTGSGRSFTARPSLWRPRAAPEVYLLAHENLHVTVLDELGADALDLHRSNWSRGGRLPRPRMPRFTPEYLLHGFTQMLRAAGRADDAVRYASTQLATNGCSDHWRGHNRVTGMEAVASPWPPQSIPIYWR